MFIKNDKFNCTARVLSFYFIDNHQYYLFIPDRDFEGLVIGIEQDSTIIDNNIEDFVETRNNFGQVIFINKYIIDAGILDEMIDYQPHAMQKFWTLCEEHNIEVFRD